MTVFKGAVALSAAETVVVPLAAQRLYILTDDGLPALAALGRPSLCALGLAVDAPGVAVLFNMRHSVAERVAALGAEEVTVMPVRAEGDDVLADDGRLAVLAARGEEFVPVEVAEEAQPLVTVVGRSLARKMLDGMSGGAGADPVDSLGADVLRLRADFHCLEAGAAAEAAEALRVEALRTAG